MCAHKTSPKFSLTWLIVITLTKNISLRILKEKKQHSLGGGKNNGKEKEQNAVEEILTTTVK